MDASVQVFRDWLVTYRENNPNGPDPSLNDLYRIYANVSNTNNNDRPVVTAGNALNQTLHNIHNGVIRIRPFQVQANGLTNQGWQQFLLNYNNLRQNDANAAQLAYVNYLNTNFSTGYTYLLPGMGRGAVNARFVLDILPRRMENIVGNIAAIMDNRNAACSMKFLSPGQNLKLDSAIVYCNSGDGSFAQLRQDLVTLQGNDGQSFFNRLPLMVAAVANGLGYAEEPPAFSYGPLNARQQVPLSFGEFRVILFLMAYRAALGDIQDDRYGDDEFDEALDQNIGELFHLFGLNVDQPEGQGAVSAPGGLQTEFIRTYALWRKNNADFYGVAARF